MGKQLEDGLNVLTCRLAGEWTSSGLKDVEV